MKSSKFHYLTIVSPLMIVISIIGFSLREESKKNYYLPIGIIGIYLICEKELKRRIHRRNILKKIDSFKNENKI
tara:strand:+ start:241 stop:462 length:222 start_codon:yes stop_codon:yes gene_type:complete